MATSKECRYDKGIMPPSTWEFKAETRMICYKITLDKRMIKAKMA
jgi:hypothetical protein